ncbi:hypothetical protein D3C78_858860 [compost metagenome]
MLVLAIVCVPPFILAYSGMVGFVSALYFAGVFSGVILSIMPILMLRSARKSGDIVPAWQCGWIAHPLIQVTVVVLYLMSMAYAICGALGWLPASW